MKTASSVRAGAVMLLLLAAVIGAIALKQHELARLRSEQEVLLDESHEAQRLAEENSEISKLRVENEEVVKLREENKDLPRLRNEARQLRRESEELEKLRAENELLAAKISAGRSVGGSVASALPADFVARSALADVGFGSPEAAAQTFFWAACQGNIERLQQGRMDGAAGRNTDPEWERRQLIEQMKDFAGFRVAEKKIISPDEVELLLQSSIDGPTMPMKLKRIGDDWKLASF